MTARGTFRIAFTRDEVCLLMDWYESMCQDYAPNEAHLLEEDSALYERIREILRKRDRAARGVPS